MAKKKDVLSSLAATWTLDSGNILSDQSLAIMWVINGWFMVRLTCRRSRGLLPPVFACLAHRWTVWALKALESYQFILLSHLVYLVHLIHHGKLINPIYHFHMFHRI